MEAIKLRGKNSTGNWLEIFRTEYENGEYGDDVRLISEGHNRNRPDLKPIPETIGQFTGLKDTNRKDIYEGDILKTTYLKSLGEDGKIKSCVIWNKHIKAWQFQYVSAVSNFATDYLDRFEHEVIGNIHDNPELLK